jgi:hypothetical protein
MSFLQNDRRAGVRHDIRQLDIRRLLSRHKRQLERGRHNQLHQERRVAFGETVGHQVPEKLLVLRGALSRDLLSTHHTPPPSLLRVQHGLSLLAHHARCLSWLLLAAGQHREGEHRHYHTAEHHCVSNARRRVDATH